LDKKGVFLITKAGERICDALSISKFTLYNYLDILRKQKQNDNSNGNGNSNGYEYEKKDED